MVADRLTAVLWILFSCRGATGAVNICGQDLGVESGVIPDASFSASSSATGKEPHHARLNGNSTWCAGTGTGNQYLQIDLGLPVNVWGIKTQGDATNAQNFVRNYNVHLSFNGVNFVDVKAVGGSNSKIFTGNTNNNGIVTVDLTTEYFSARYIRIIPTQSSGARCLRVEIQGCTQYCPFALGVEDGSGPVLTASTSAGGSPPTSAKLGTSSAWCASSTNAGQYLLVDLQKTMTVTGIAMQGSPTEPNWIKTFRVHFGVTSASSTLKNKNTNIFNGNVDQNSVAINWFSSPITARFVKIGVQEFNNQICARIELIGCKRADCVLPLGLESNVITDSQMTASSQYNTNTRADRGRLNKLSRWCSKDNEAVTSSYLQIDLGFVATVTGVMTQADYNWAPNYVRTYQLSYDFDQSANTLRCVRNEGNNDCKQFTGNINGNGAVLNMFPDQAFSARVVRIRPQSRSGGASCLRVELYGCKQGFGATKGLQLGSQIATGVSVDSSIGVVNPPTFQLNGGTAWCPGGVAGYLEVSFGGETMVAGVAIQGSPTSDSWATKYRLSTRTTIGAALSSVENDKEYQGSYNRDSAVVNWLASPLPTTAIRITVVTLHTDACLRIEMYGLNAGCANPLPQTDDNQFTASSIYSNNNRPPKGRLNSHPYAWVACYTNPNCQTDTTPHGWLQVCFNAFRTVSGVIIQGLGDQTPGGMKKFTIRYSYDGTIMNDYKLNGTEEEFIGNANRYEGVTRLFPKPVATKCIRVVATERFPPGGDTSARIQPLGCDPAILPTVTVEDTVISLTKTSPVKNVDCVIVAQARATFHWKRGPSVVVNDTVHTVTVTAPTDETNVENQWTLTLQVNPANVGQKYESCVIADAAQGLATCSSVYTCVASYPGAIAVTKTATVTVTELSAKIGQPSNIMSNSITATSAVITWDAPVQTGDFPITDYSYVLSPGGRNGSVDLAVPLSSLLPYTDYTVSVKARNKLQDGITAPIQFKTLQAAPPAVTNFRNMSFAASFVNLAWDAPSPPNGLLSSYEIHFRKNSASTSSSVIIGDVTIINYRLDLPTPDTIYIISIRAKTGENAFTGPAVTINVRTNEKPPDPPTALSVTSSKPTTVSLSWLAPSVTNGDLISYMVSYEGFKSYFPSFTDQNSTVVPWTELTATVSGLFPGTAYRFTVSASSRAGFGDRSNDVNATLGVAAPLKPSVRVTTSPVEADGELNITLIGVDGFTGEITGYEVILSTGNLSCSEITSAALAPATQFTSFTPEQIPYNAVVMKGIETVDGLGFVIPTPGITWMCFRALVQSGPNIYYGAVESFQVERQFIKKPNTTSLGASPTSSSFIVELAQGLPTTSFYQVVVIELLQGKMTPPLVQSYYQNRSVFKFNATSHKAGTAYITGEFTAASFEEMKRFTVGDGKTYPLNNRRRRSTSSGEQFINVALSPGSRYAVFQIAVSGSGSWQVSPWSSIVATAGIPHEENGSGAGTAVGITFAVLAVVAVVVVVWIVYKRKRRSKDQPSKKVEFHLHQHANPSAYENCHPENRTRAAAAGVYAEPGSFYEQPSLEATIETSHPVIRADSIVKFTENMQHNNMRGFRKEYKELSTCDGYINISTQSEGGDNTYDSIDNHSGYQKLTHTFTGQRHNTCMQATYVDGYSSPKTYITVEEPLLGNRVAELWKMVWEENSQAIVIVTDTLDAEKEECELYGSTLRMQTYKEITVAPMKTNNYAKYATRLLQLRKEGESRAVTLFHFFAWPAVGVPEFPTDILNFEHHFRSLHPPNESHEPIVIHSCSCSSLTSTFLSMDAMLQLVASNQVVDLFNYVNRMRSSGMQVIKTDDHYIFVYTAIAEAIMCGSTKMPSKNVPAQLKLLASSDGKEAKRGYEKQFELLDMLAPTLKRNDTQAASKRDNQAKNRSKDILPRDCSRVILQHNTKEDHSINYINAVYTDGIEKREAVIATQHPLDATINDFWFMVFSAKPSMIVSLSQPMQYPPFWPSDGEALGYGKANVWSYDMTTKGALDQGKLNIEKVLKHANASVSCDLLHYKEWPDHGCPTDKSSVLSLLLAIEKSKKTHSAGPIVIVCSDGAGRSGSLITILMALEQIKRRQMVDIFEIVKTIRLVRPQYVENKGQYEFCHNIVHAYLTSIGTYMDCSTSRKQELKY